METKVIYNSDLHFEHERWRSELRFWKDELRSFRNRLEELVLRWMNSWKGLKSTNPVSPGKAKRKKTLWILSL